MKYKNLVLCGLAIFFSANAIAQRRDLYTLESPYERYTYNLATLKWVAAVPMGSITDGYVDKASFGNYAFSLEWVFRQIPVSGGIEAGKYYFEQRYPRATYKMGNNDVSAVKTSTFSTVPLMAFAKYHFLGTNAQLSPYVQVNLGAHFNNYIDYFGSLADQKRKTTFGFAGAAGLKYFFKKDGSFGLDLSVRYDQNTFKYEYIQNGFSAFSGSAGLFYRWW